MNKRHKWNFLRFLAPDGVETGSAEDLSNGSVEEDGESGGEGEGTAKGGATAAKDPNEEIRTAMAKLAGTVTELAKPKEVTKQPTQEEINTHWAIYNPTASRKDFFEKFFRLAPDMDPEEKKRIMPELQEVWKDMQQGLVKQAVVGARNLLMDEIAKLRKDYDERLGPVNEFVGQQRAEKLRSEFFSAYPALDVKTEAGTNQFDAVIKAVANSLANKEFTNSQEYFKALAEGVANTIKSVLPTFDLGAKPQQKPAGTSPRLPRTSVGGTGGTSRGGAAPTKAEESDDDAGSLDWIKKPSLA